MSLGLTSHHGEYQVLLILLQIREDLVFSSSVTRKTQKNGESNKGEMKFQVKVAQKTKRIKNQKITRTNVLRDTSFHEVQPKVAIIGFLLYGSSI